MKKAFFAKYDILLIDNKQKGKNPYGKMSNAQH